MGIKRFFPLLQSLSTYSGKLLKKDIIAGLTVWVMLVPQGMAYALLAGLPPIYGLYGGLIPLLLYGIFGTSRHLSIGPVAISALLILAGISQIVEPGTTEYIELVILTGLLIGLVQFLASLFRLGFLVNFLSHPVIAGFTSAAAIIISVNQLKYLMGIEIPRFSSMLDTVGFAIQNIQSTHLLTFGLCVGGIVLMLILKKIHKSIPGALIITLLGILIVRFFNLEQQGIDIVGAVPEGLPTFQIPEWSIDKIKLVFPTVLTVSIMSLVESISIAKVWERKHKKYKIRPNQELLAIGISKIGGGFFQAIPTSGSFTRSAVNSESGGQTQVSSIITAFFIGLTLLFICPFFFFLPKAILASIILLSVRSLFDYKEAIHLWKSHKGDFSMMIATFLITLIFGIEEGVLAGVVLSVLMVMYRSARPHIAVLGQLPDTKHYRNVSRFPDAIQLPDCLIVRFDSQLFFANATYFKEIIENLMEDKTNEINGFILDASNIDDIDSSGLKAFESVCEFLKKEYTEFYIAGAIGPVRDRFYKAGLMEKIGRENQFIYVQDAVDAFVKRKQNKEDNWSENAIQTNVDLET